MISKISFQDFKEHSKQLLYIFITVCLSCLIIGSLFKTSYKAYVVVAPAEDQGGLGSMIGGQLGSSMLSGLLQTDTTDIQIALATLKSKIFLFNFVNDNNLNVELGNVSTRWEVHKEMSKRLEIEKISGSTLINISLKLSSPELAAKHLNNLIFSLNAYLRDNELNKIDSQILSYENSIKVTESLEKLKLLYALLERAMGKKVMLLADDEFVLRTIDPAQPPRLPFWPNYLLLFILSLFLSILISVLFVIFKIRNK